jgi:KaiC/GvpD/RAD55 family RecA-like ATPase
MIFTHSEIEAYYKLRIPELKFTSQREWRCKCPVHSGQRESFAIQSDTGLAHCFSQCGRGWDMISLEMELGGLDFPRAKDRVFEVVGRPKVPWADRNLEATYDYVDENGKLLYQVIREYGKKFRQRRPDGNGGWVYGLADVRRVPYQLPKVLAADFVAICEGEKDCNTLSHLGITATCNNGGAGNFRADLGWHFEGKQVAIFPDNDEPGREHALKVAPLVGSVARSLKIVELPGLPAKGDVTDFVSAGGTIEQIRELYRKAQPWSEGWQFAVDVPDENDRYVRTIEDELEAAGGLTAFWDLARHSGLATPFPQLNWALGGGLRDSEVYVIGANQGAGKTSIAIQFALCALRHGGGVLMFSMEMIWKDVFQRMVGIEAGVDLGGFRDSQRRHQECQDTWLRLSRSTADIAGWRLLVSTKPSVTPDYIVSETKRLSKRAPLNLVIVDHMQLMSADIAARSDYEKFTAISRAMKQTAMEVRIPVIIVSQTSRSNSREHRAELDVADLRGSGAIEEDAAGVFLLYEDREDATLARQTDGGGRYATGPVKSWLKVGKNRYGAQGGCVPLLHFKSQTRFEVPLSQEGVNERCA